MQTFRLLANCFLLIFSDLALFIFPTLLADIQRPKYKSANCLHPLFSFTLSILNLI